MVDLWDQALAASPVEDRLAPLVGTYPVDSSPEVHTQGMGTPQLEVEHNPGVVGMAQVEGGMGMVLLVLLVLWVGHANHVVGRAPLDDQVVVVQASAMGFAGCKEVAPQHIRMTQCTSL